MSEQDGKIVNLGGLKKFKEYYDTDIITPINNKINSKTNVQSGEIITTNNDTIGYFKNIKIKGNTRYKKSNGTYTDTWESGVSLESMGEKEKNSNGKYPVEVVSCGKNLAFTATSSGNVKLNTIVDTNKLVVGKQYVISAKHIDTTKKVHMCFYKSDGTKVSNTYDASSPLKFTYSKDIDNITFSTEDVWTWCDVIDIQLEKGTTATTYEPYKEDKRTVLLDEPLRKFGEVADILDLDNSQITRKCSSVILDGSSDEIWTFNTIKMDNIILFDCRNMITEKFAPQNYDIHLISDKFPSFRYDNMWDNTNEGISVSNEAILINISKTKLETQDGEGLKKWLQSNPVTIVYELATPITEDIEVSSNTLTDFTTSCTLTIDNTIKGNIECNEVVGLIPSVEEDGTRLTNLETDNTTNKNNITNLQQENQTLKNNVKALEYVINNSNRLNYTGQVITNSNSVVGDIRNIIVNGNTRYKKSDGTYTDTWESGVSIESIGEKEKDSNGKYPIEVVSCGKNLFSTELFDMIKSIEHCQKCSWDKSKGILHLQWDGVVTNPILLNPKVKENTQYILSFDIQSDTNWSPNGIRIKYTDGTESYSGVTLSSSTDFQRVATKSSANKTISYIYWVGNTTINVKNLQLEISNDLTDYEPYKEDKRTVLLDSPLRKVGTITDVLDLGKSQITRKCYKVVLDNNIEGYETNSKNGKKGYNITLSKKAKDGKLICDKLPVVNEYIVWEETIGIYIKNNEIIIYHNGERLTDFKTWLASNPITVVYALATPTTEDIEVSPTDNPLTSYTPSTTLTTNNTIKGNISADMPTNLSGVITQQANAIASLQDTVLQTQSALIENEYNNLI